MYAVRRLVPLLLAGLLLTSGATAVLPAAVAGPPLAVNGYALSDLKASVLDREAPAYRGLSQAAKLPPMRERIREARDGEEGR